MSPASPNGLDQRMAELAARRVPFVRATVVRARRPTSANPGDTALVLEDGSMEGFVGGSCAEATVRRFSLEVLETGEPVLLRISPDQIGDGDLVDGAIVVGNPCLSGGELEVFLEPRRPAPRVVVLGDTPIARNLILLGQDLGYDLVLIDGGAGSDEATRGAAAVIVASHGQDEETVLTAALVHEVPYVALVASRKRAAGVLGSLDVSPEQRAAVRAPAGLDIGAHTAGEVALSILAEVVASVRRPAGAEGAAGANGDQSAPDEGQPEPETSRSASGGGPASDDGGQSAADGLADGIAPSKRQDRFGAKFAVDPICGMTVAAVDSTPHSDVTGERQWFCSGGCKSAFEAEQVTASAG